MKAIDRFSAEETARRFQRMRGYVASGEKDRITASNEINTI
jgi:hypothetical protein